MAVNHLNVEFREQKKENSPKQIRKEGKVQGFFMQKVKIPFP